MNRSKPKPVIRSRAHNGMQLVEAWDDEAKRWKEIDRVHTREEVIAIILDERGATEDIGERPQAA